MQTKQEARDRITEHFNGLMEGSANCDRVKMFISQEITEALTTLMFEPPKEDDAGT